MIARVVCRWCGEDMGRTVEIEPSPEILAIIGDGQPESHGMCDQCRDRMLAEIEEECHDLPTLR